MKFLARAPSADGVLADHQTSREPASQRWLLAFLSLALVAVLPLFVVKYPPSHDFPQHLAAVHMLRVFPEQGLGSELELHLARTQYIGFYALAALCSIPLGDVLGTKLVIAVIALSIPAGMWTLLRALRKDERLAFFALPLTLSTPLLFGLYNYMAGIGLMLFALASAVQLARAYSNHRFAALLLLLSAMVLTHPVPAAFAMLGSGLVLIQRELRTTLRNLVSLAPLLILTIVWTLHATAAGPTTDVPDLDASRTFEVALARLPGWLTCVLKTHLDEFVFYAWGGVALVLLGWGAFKRSSFFCTEGFARRLALLVPLAWLGYFLLPEKHLWVYPVASRFAVLAALLSIIVLPSLVRPKMSLLSALLGILVMVQVVAQVRAFRGVEREQGDIDQAIESIPESRRVAGLIFNQGSKHVTFRTFRHYLALYQARKGGLVSRSFVGLPTSPFAYKREEPSVPPWSKKEADIDPVQDFPSFEYLLVSGRRDDFVAPAGAFTKTYDAGKRWRVYRRVDPQFETVR